MTAKQAHRKIATLRQFLRENIALLTFALLRVSISPPLPYFATTLLTDDPRVTQLHSWLSRTLDQPLDSLLPASADASFRRYFRAQCGPKSWIVMDAPPDKEPIGPFLSAASALEQQGVHTPQIVAYDAKNGFILMEDLGDQAYLQNLPQRADELYSEALDTLLKIQLGSRQQPGYKLAAYDQQKLEQELDLFNEWYVERHLQLRMDRQQQAVWRATKDILIAACQEQPQVWVHRDYHSRNLMVTEQRCPGVIDFQDMVIGPIAYDVVSLLKDCYVEYPRSAQLNWCQLYLEKARASGVDTIDEAQFIRWFDLTGLQRHIKVLGVFTRLHHRDQKSGYLQDIPLVRRYIEEALPMYSELHAFAEYFASLPHAE